MRIITFGFLITVRAPLVDQVDLLKVDRRTIIAERSSSFQGLTDRQVRRKSNVSQTQARRKPDVSSNISAVAKTLEKR